jgi:hypothetical protein
MPAATNAQVQQFCDERIRPHCELLRALFAIVEDDRNAMADVLLNVNDALSTWQDTRQDAPATLLVKADIQKYKRVCDDLIALKTTGSISDEWPTVISACVRPLQIVTPGP